MPSHAQPGEPHTGFDLSTHATDYNEANHKQHLVKEPL